MLGGVFILRSGQKHHNRNVQSLVLLLNAEINQRRQTRTSFKCLVLTDQHLSLERKLSCLCEVVTWLGQWQMDHGQWTLPCCCLWVQAVVQGPRTACWPRQRWSGSQIRDNTAPQIRSADQKAFVPWELHVWVEILLCLSCIWSWGGGVGPTAEDMVWHSRLTQRAWWKLPRRNEGNLACGSKWIAWMEYMALSNEVVFFLEFISTT